MLALALAAGLAACGQPSSAAQPAATPAPAASASPDAPSAAPPTPAREEPTMSSDQIQTGPVPEDLDQRLERRDTDPLPVDALVRFQLINRGPSPHPNYRWLLYADGRLFLARHSGDRSDPYTPFDTELPREPSSRLSADVVAQVERALADSGFFTQPPYQLDTTVEDGAFYVVTAQLDGQTHEVIYEAHRPAPVDFLLTIASQ